MDGILKDAMFLAETIIDPDNWWDGHFGDYDDQLYHCKYCMGNADKIKYNFPRSIKHDADCPVLVALDILTEGRTKK
jgi:hypothetical protein